MISKDTILSIFNEKGTLLKWLQKLEKALKNDTLTGVTISQPTTTQAVLTFTFKDGTTLDSAVIDLPSGAPGINGTNGTDGKDGAPGKNGNGIVSINSEASYVSGNDTITPITIETDDSTEHITVSARNGTDGTNGINGTNGTDGAIHALGTHNLTGPDGNSYRLSEIFSANGILKPGQIVLFRGDKTENGKLYKYVGERNLLESGWKPWNAADWEYEGNLRGDQGQPGNDGVGIESITTLGYRPGTGANVGYTETMLKAHMTNNIDKNLSVFAKDGQADAPEFGFVEFENMPESTVIKYINKSGIKVAADSTIIKPQLNTPIMVNMVVEGLPQLRFLDEDNNAYLDSTEVIIINSNNTVKTYNFVPDFISSVTLTPGKYMIIITPRTATTVGNKYLKIALSTPQ